jgi:hypothetical protein
VALLAYLGLAILGWGGFAAFFSHSALIALTILLFALSGVAIFSGGNLSRGVREDRANRWVIVAFGLIGVLAAYLPAYTDRKGFWTLDGDARRPPITFHQRRCTRGASASASNLHQLNGRDSRLGSTHFGSR